MMPALVFNFIIAATKCLKKFTSGTGMLWPLLNFFLLMYHNFCKKNVKKENRLCLLPYEEVLENIMKAVLTEQCGNL